MRRRTRILGGVVLALAIAAVAPAAWMSRDARGKVANDGE